jgi:peptidoglycan biosynthesis protein MviN/MurJ (putative lipid II flippase)
MIVLAEPALCAWCISGVEFDAAATARVAAVLRWYASRDVRLVGQLRAFARGLYSLQDTLTPALLGTMTTAADVPTEHGC